MILCLWSPLHPLSKLLAIQDHAQNLEEQLWMGGRREVSVISHRPVTSSDLKHERLFFCGSVSTVLQLVLAFVFVMHCLKLHCFRFVFPTLGNHMYIFWLWNFVCDPWKLWQTMVFILLGNIACSLKFELISRKIGLVFFAMELNMHEPFRCLAHDCNYRDEKLWDVSKADCIARDYYIAFKALESSWRFLKFSEALHVCSHVS